MIEDGGVEILLCHLTLIVGLRMHSKKILYRIFVNKFGKPELISIHYLLFETLRLELGRF